MIVLEPRKINERMLKIQQQNKKMLMENDVLDIDFLAIDESWDFDLEPKYIKTKKIIRNIWLKLDHIPSWMNNIEIEGNFYCDNCDLISLKNCPKIIHKSFDCSYNKLTSLDDGPTYVGKNYFCNKNIKIFKMKNIKNKCIVKGNIYNYTNLKEYIFYKCKNFFVL